MVQQESQQQGFSSSNIDSGGGSNRGGNRSSKKNKQKKPPQRGMGVAQLEKIRIEEQEKAKPPSGFITPLPQLPQPLVPFPATASRSLIGHPVRIPSITNSPEPLAAPPPHELAAAAGLAVLPPTGSTAGHGCLPTLWNPLEFGVDAAAPWRLDRRTSMKIEGHSPRIQLPQQQLNLPTSLVNASPSSAGASLQMEPPSNQINASSYHRPPQEEDRIVGMKRSWPFPFESISSPTPFPCRPPLVPRSSSNPDDLASMHGFDPSKSEQRHINFREGSTCNRTPHVDPNGSGNFFPEQGFKEVDGGFLTLGSTAPSNPSRPLITKSKEPADIPSSLNHGSSQFALPSYQGLMNDAILGFGSSEPPAEPPFYRFLPTGPGSQETTASEQRGETEDGIDLNLKL